MKQVIAAMCFALAATPFAFAQDKAKDTEKKAAVAAEKSPAGTDRMKGTGEEKKSPEKASMERPKGKSEGSQPPKKEPSEKQKAQQARMKECNDQASGKSGDDRKKFMSSCLKKRDDTKADKGEKRTAQQTKMGECNKDAADKKIKGDDRKKFMKECLSK